MKNILLIAFILISSFTIAQKKFEKKFTNGFIEETGFFDKTGLKDSVWTSYNEKGILIGEGHFSHGIKIGVWKTFYEDGKIMFEIPYVGGYKKGEGKQFKQTEELIASKNY